MLLTFGIERPTKIENPDTNKFMFIRHAYIMFTFNRQEIL